MCLQKRAAINLSLSEKKIILRGQEVESAEICLMPEEAMQSNIFHFTIGLLAVI